MRSAIVGCGGIAAVHSAILNDMANVEFIACADIIAERARALAEKYSLKPYTDYVDMLDSENIDVLHICAPHYLHVPMAIEALNRGINVFMEKPAAISRAQFGELESAAAKANAKLGICFQNRFNPGTQLLKQLVDSGEGGRVLGARAFVTWSRNGDYYTKSGWRGALATEGGGALINQSIHTLDLLVYLLGRPVAVEATRSNRHLKGVIEVEDTLEAYIRFAGANALFYATTAYCENSPVMLEVAFERMTARIEGDVATIRDSNGTISNETLASNATLGKDYWGSGHKSCIESFYASLGGSRSFPITLDAVRPTMELMFAAYESTNLHTEITL